MRFQTSLYILALVLFAIPVDAQNTTGTSYSWKAGVSQVIITPQMPMPMAGFASRTHSSEGMLHDLWAKALVIEDANGKKAVMVSSDLLGFPKSVSDNIRAKLKTRFGLNKEQVLLNSSHTHSGPVLEGALSDIYALNARQIDDIKQYSISLENKIVELVGNGIKDMETAELYHQNGVTRFQVNRRNNSAVLLTQLSELQGPNDFAVPVIKVITPKGKIKAIAFGYSCHPTVLNGYQWSGDYPGFAQLELEKLYPGTTALFFQGAGADQNPLPRNTVPLARQYGKELTAAVERVLEEDMKKLPAHLTTTYSELDLALDTAPSESSLENIIKTSAVPYQKKWAERMLTDIKSGKKMRNSYPYPLQAWSVGGLPLVSLGGELVVEYGIKIKQMLGADALVFGYSNDVMTYIPSSTILKEGGYEGELAHSVYGLPSKWKVGVESNILSEVYRLAVQAGLLTGK